MLLLVIVFSILVCDQIESHTWLDKYNVEKTGKV